jgi:hypothetical protein
MAKCFEMWWPGTELNRRRQPFQGCALPPELPGHVFTAPLSNACVGHTRLAGIAGNRGQSNCWERVEQHRL